MVGRLGAVEEGKNECHWGWGGGAFHDRRASKHPDGQSLQESDLSLNRANHKKRAILARSRSTAIDRSACATVSAIAYISHVTFINSTLAASHSGSDLYCSDQPSNTSKSNL